MSNNKNTNDTYEVGYGRPPKTSRFPKGCSGNPKGRPKGTRNLKTDLLDELNEQITLSEGGKAITLSKQRALLKSLMARAIKGDGRAVNALLNLMLRVLDPSDEEDTDEPLSADEQAILANLEQRILARAEAQIEGRSKPAGQGRANKISHSLTKAKCEGSGGKK